MKINDCLGQATKQLEAEGISTARLDALVLLEHVSKVDRSWLLAHGERSASKQTAKAFQSAIDRRAKYEPIAYIRGKSEFYGREFHVNQYTLEPRPETETMIEIFLELEISSGGIIDVGTGSGCLAITVKLECPELEVIAIDIDAKCIETAKKNAKKLGADITLLQGNLLKPPKVNADILLCNLPYVPDSHTINAAAMFEPKHAIFGGPDGLDLYRELFEQIANSSQFPEYILTESLPFQHKELTKIAKQAGYKLKTSEDFIQVFSLDS